MYRASEEAIATVSASGTVTPRRSGVVTIFANSEANERYQAWEGSYQLTVSKQLVSLEFALGRVVTRPVSSPFRNPVYGLEEDIPVEYQSSDEGIAIVDGDGKVNMFMPGDVSISARIPDNDQYQGASIEYQLSAANSLLTETGKDGTIAHVTDNLIGYDFLRSTDLACRFSEASLCDNEQSDRIDSNQVSDTAFTLQTEAVYAFRNNTQQSSNLFMSAGTALEEAVESFRPDSFVFNGRLYIPISNDLIYSSNDLKKWRKEIDLAELISDRAAYVVFNGFLYTYSKRSGEYWKSEDGVTWEQGTFPLEGDFRGIKAHEYDGKLYVRNAEDAYYSTSNGDDWLAHTAPFENALSGSFVGWNGKLYLFGFGSRQWVSEDGVSWEEFNHSPPPFDKVIQYKGKLLAFSRNNTYVTDDLITWERSTNPLYCYGCDAALVAQFNDRLYQFAGPGKDRAIGEDIWVSDDGLTLSLIHI